MIRPPNPFFPARKAGNKQPGWRASIQHCSILFFVMLISGCQLPYLTRSAVDQMSLLNSRVKIDKVLQDEKVSAADKEKLRVAQEARHFTAEKMSLKESNSYTTFVQLDRPYVSWTVTAAPKWELKAYEWYFPIVGHVPYKGFFREQQALEEAEELKQQDYDVYVRGVSAYSTLGWFNDPILSSMLRGKEYDLVNTIIHETVHANIFIKSSADFNERLATFLGNQGTEDFYLAKNPSIVEQIKKENDDEKVFSEFISKELKELTEWYKNQKDKNEDARQARLKKIQERFRTEVRPRLKILKYESFEKIPLNNARLVLWKTYVEDLSDFQKLFELSNRSYSKFVEYCHELESQGDPESALKRLLQRQR